MQDSGNHRRFATTGEATIAASSHTLLIHDASGLRTAGARLDGVAWTRTADGELDDAYAFTVTDTPLASPRLAVGRWFACVSADGGAPACWGAGADGRLGGGDLAPQL